MSSVNKMNEYVIAPGETILELLEVNSMTKLDFSKKTGFTLEVVDGLIKGNVHITDEIAKKLEEVFNISASFWNNLESEYREVL